MSKKKRFFAGLVSAWLLQVCCLHGAGAARYESTISQLTKTAEAEVQAGSITGVTIALVDDQEIVFVKGFGLADRKRRIKSAADTVYRAGSISKLFTAVAAVQLTEQGRLDLDAPVTRYLPDFRVIVPFENSRPITLRQLMCHRSGMVREAPVGGYFDDSEPGMEKTIGSLASCVLVYPPGTRTKYSNSGVTIVGRAVERVTGTAFPSYQKHEVLGPLGMTSSSFLRTPEIRKKLAVGYLPVAKATGGHREIEAPVFEFGILAAGNLYTTAEDLGRFLACLFAEGRANGRQLVLKGSLDGMFTPQLTSETNGFGLGFSIGNFRGQKTVNHMGAVYGFTSSLSGMPSEKIGVIVLCNDDINTGPVRKLNATALSLMLAAKGGTPRTNEAPAAPGQSSLAGYEGDFESQSYWARIDVEGGRLVANVSGQKLVLTATGPEKFEANGRVAYKAPVAFERDSSGKITGFTALEQKFRRVNPDAGSETPLSWKAFFGSYGPEFIPLIVSSRHGHLYAMTENEFDYRLTPMNRYVFQMPPGLYEGEQLIFQTERNGKVHTAVLANMSLKRRP